MSGNLPGPRNRKRMREQWTAAVAGVAHALRDPGQDREERCLEGILKKHGQVELFAPQFPGQANPAA